MTQAAVVNMVCEANSHTSGWEQVLLDSVAKRGSGHTPDKKHPEYWGGSIKWISLQDSARLNSLYIDDTAATITAEGIKNSSAVLHPKGTVVLSRDAGVGKSAIMADDMAVSQHFMAWTCSQRLDNHFLYYWLQSKKPEFERIANGNTIKTIGLPYFKELIIPLPTADEQKRIASALSDMDILISSLDQLIAKKRDIQQATMQQLLTGQQRLPGFSGEWIECTFGEVFSGFTSGATPYRGNPEFYDGDIRWITSGELNYGAIHDTNEKITSDAVAKTNLRVLPAGTFLMAITGLEAAGTRGSCGIVGAPSATNQSCMAIFPTEKAVIEYLFHYYVLRGDSLAINYCQGTKQQSYTARIVKKLPITLPSSVEEQRAISSILSDLNAEIALLETRRGKARQLKQGMMQELLTGRIRLL